MKSKRIFIVKHVLTTGQIECRIATVLRSGEARVSGARGSSTLLPGEYAENWNDAKALAESARTERCAELQSELNHLRSTTFQRIGG